MKKRFCAYQIKCEDDNNDSFSCAAHLDTGLCFCCPYSSYADAKKRKYPCVDAKPIGGRRGGRKEQ